MTTEPGAGGEQGIDVRVGDLPDAFHVAAIARGEYLVRHAADRHVALVVTDGDRRWVFLAGEVFELSRARPTARRRGGAAPETLSAPMPARVVRVLVAAGAAVRRGETLLVLEAMKMELPLRAAGDGRVRHVHCREGDLVDPGVPLIELE